MDLLLVEIVHIEHLAYKIAHLHAMISAKVVFSVVSAKPAEMMLVIKN